MHLLEEALNKKDADPKDVELNRKYISLAFSFVTKNSDCIWCHNGKWIVDLLILYSMKENETSLKFKQISAAQLSKCCICVDSYHRLKNELFEKFKKVYDEKRLSAFEKVIFDWDVERIVGIMNEGKNLTSSSIPNALMYAFYEVLKYPILLKSEKLQCIFSLILDRLVKAKRMLRVKSFLPGVLLGLVHDDEQMRKWAIGLSSVIQKESKSMVLNDEMFEESKPIIVEMINALTGEMFGDDSAQVVVKNGLHDRYLLTRNKEAFFEGFLFVLNSLSPKQLNELDIDSWMPFVVNEITSIKGCFWYSLRAIVLLLRKIGDSVYEKIHGCNNSYSLFKYLLNHQLVVSELVSKTPPQSMSEWSHPLVASPLEYRLIDENIGFFNLLFHTLLKDFVGKDYGLATQRFSRVVGYDTLSYYIMSENCDIVFISSLGSEEMARQVVSDLLSNDHLLISSARLFVQKSFQVDCSLIESFAEKILCSDLPSNSNLVISQSFLWSVMSSSNDTKFVDSELYFSMAIEYGKVVLIDIAYIRNILEHCGFAEVESLLQNLVRTKDIVHLFREMFRNFHRTFPDKSMKEIDDKIYEKPCFKESIKSLVRMLCSPVEPESWSVETLLVKLYKVANFQDCLKRMLLNEPQLVCEAIISLAHEITRWLKLGLSMHYVMRSATPIFSLAMECLFLETNLRYHSSVLDALPNKMELLCKLWNAVWTFGVSFVEKSVILFQIREMMKVDVHVIAVFRFLQSLIIPLLDLKLYSVFTDSEDDIVPFTHGIDTWMPIFCYIISMDNQNGKLCQRGIGLLLWILKALKHCNTTLSPICCKALYDHIVNKPIVSQEDRGRLKTWIRLLESSPTVINADEQMVDNYDSLPIGTDLLFDEVAEEEEEEEDTVEPEFDIPMNSSLLFETSTEMLDEEEKQYEEKSDNESEDISLGIEEIKEESNRLKKKYEQEAAKHRGTKLIEIEQVHRLAVRKERHINQATEKNRLSPDLSKFHRQILSWTLDDLNLSMWPSKAIPTKFSSFEHYNQVFEPLLLEECKSQIVKSKEESIFNEIPFTMNATSQSNVDDFLDVTFQVQDQEAWEKNAWIENDLVQCACEDFTSLAMVNNIRNEKKSNCIEVVLRFLLSTPARNHYSLFRKDSAWSLIRLINLITVNREFQALRGLPYYDLASNICNPDWRIEDISNVTCLKQMRMSLKLNDPQAAALYHSVTTNNPFVLIQGPPGTGKSRTIGALVAALLKPSQFMPNYHSPIKRLLVCAPSNAAVDELVRRFTEGIPRENGLFRPQVVRLGSGETMHQSVRSCSLDTLTDARVRGYSSGTRTYDDLKKQVVDIENQLKESKKKLSEMTKEKDGVKYQEALYICDRYRAQLAQMRQQCKDYGKNVDENRQRARIAVLNQAQVICCTLSSSGHELLQRVSGGFPLVIVDEACQSIELSSLIPLKYNASKCVLVGDPNQLPPTVISQSLAYEQSLFQRLMMALPDSVLMLSVQYRMHQEISFFPSSYFYQGKISNGPPEQMMSCNQPWHKDVLTSAYQFLDVPGTEQVSSSKSLMNNKEAVVAAKLVYYLVKQYPTLDFNGRIAVITPYKQQRNELRRQINSIIDLKDIEICTVDAFQGQEREIIIFSCVRATLSASGIGFLSDTRRLNVALTRAKASMFILGNASSLCRNPMFGALINDSILRKKYIAFDSAFWNCLPGPKIEETVKTQPLQQPNIVVSIPVQRASSVLPNSKSIRNIHVDDSSFRSRDFSVPPSSRARYAKTGYNNDHKENGSNGGNYRHQHPSPYYSYPPQHRFAKKGK